MAASASAAAKQRLRRASDPRVIGGVVVMIVSAYLGLMLTSRGPQPVLVAVAARDLPAGVALQSDDVSLREVVLADPQRYLQSADVSGSLQTDIAEGELIPRRAVSPKDSQLRLVAVPVEAQRLPPGIGRGSLVDVWATGDRPVLQAVAVSGVTDPEQWAGATATVVLAVQQADVAALLAATRADTVDVTAYQGQQ